MLSLYFLTYVIDMEEEIIKKWLEFKNSQGCSYQTVEKYHGYIARMVRFLDDKGLTLSTVKEEDLEVFCGVFLMNNQISHRGRGPVISAVRGFFKWARDKKFRKDNPAENIEYPKIGRRLPRFMPLQDLEKILLQPDLESLMGIRDAAIIALFAGTGIRLSAMTRLNLSNLIFVRDTKGKERLVLKVIDKGDKERMVPVPEEARLLLRAYLGHPELENYDLSLSNADRVLFISLNNHRISEHDYFGENRRLSSRSIQEMIKKYAYHARVDVSLAHPHALRHLYGTELAENNVNVLHIMSLMGHASADTSQIYNHTAIRKLAKIAEDANPLGKITTPVSSMV